MHFSALPRSIAAALLTVAAFAQQDPALTSKPSEHVIGTVVSADVAGQAVTLKEDSTGVEHIVRLQDTKTLLKVAPGAKDLKSATRISATDLSPGDRIDVRGFGIIGAPDAIAAKSVVLMSGRDLQHVHQEEATAWRKSTGGTVAAIDLSNGTITVNTRAPAGMQPVAVSTANATFTRYSPDHPKTANSSKFSDIQPGDQVRIVGEKSDDGTKITAQKIYSGTFKTLAATITSLAPDGKSIVVKDLGTKQSVTVMLSNDSSLHKLPPMMAAMLARRLNPDARSTGNSGEAGAGGRGAPSSYSRTERPNGQSPGGQPQRNPQGPAGGEAMPGEPVNSAGPGGFRGGRGGSGDLSQMLDRLPQITTNDLKPGDAVILSGSPSPADKSTLLANSLVAGVEPILQSASPRQAQSLGDWSSLGAGPGGADSGGQAQ